MVQESMMTRRVEVARDPEIVLRIETWWKGGGFESIAGGRGLTGLKGETFLVRLECKSHSGVEGLHNSSFTTNTKLWILPYGRNQEETGFCVDP